MAKSDLKSASKKSIPSRAPKKPAKKPDKKPAAQKKKVAEKSMKKPGRKKAVEKPAKKPVTEKKPKKAKKTSKAVPKDSPPLDLKDPMSEMTAVLKEKQIDEMRPQVVFRDFRDPNDPDYKELSECDDDDVIHLHRPFFGDIYESEVENGLFEKKAPNLTRLRIGIDDPAEFLMLRDLCDLTRKDETIEAIADYGIELPLDDDDAEKMARGLPPAFKIPIGYHVDQESTDIINWFMKRLPTPETMFAFRINTGYYYDLFEEHIMDYREKHGTLSPGFTTVFASSLINNCKLLPLHYFARFFELTVEDDNQLAGSEMYHFIIDANRTDEFLPLMQRFLEINAGRLMVDHIQVLNLMEMRYKMERGLTKELEKALLKVIDMPFPNYLVEICLERGFLHTATHLVIGHQVPTSDNLITAIIARKEEKLIKFLHEYNYPFDRMQLVQACEIGDFDLIDLLLDCAVETSELSLLTLLSGQATQGLNPFPIEGLKSDDIQLNLEERQEKKARITELMMRMIEAGAPVTKKTVIMSIPLRIEIPNLQKHNVITDQDIEDFCAHYDFYPKSYRLKGEVSDPYIEKQFSRRTLAQLKTLIKKRDFLPNTKCLEQACLKEENQKVINYLLKEGVMPTANILKLYSTELPSTKKTRPLVKMIDKYQYVEEHLRQRIDQLEHRCQQLEEELNDGKRLKDKKSRRL